MPYFGANLLKSQYAVQKPLSIVAARKLQLLSTSKAFLVDLTSEMCTILNL